MGKWLASASDSDLVLGVAALAGGASGDELGGSEDALATARGADVAFCVAVGGAVSLGFSCPASTGATLAKAIAPATKMAKAESGIPALLISVIQASP